MVFVLYPHFFAHVKDLGLYYLFSARECPFQELVSLGSRVLC